MCHGVASTTLYLVVAVRNMQKPSWCLAVMTRYFCPAASAVAAIRSASNFTGSNWSANLSYVATGTLALVMYHSPWAGTA